MKRITYTFLLFFCIITLACAPTTKSTSQVGLPTSAPEKVDVSAERLQEIAPALQDYIDKGQLPGLPDSHRATWEGRSF